MIDKKTEEMIEEWKEIGKKLFGGTGERVIAAAILVLAKEIRQLPRNYLDTPLMPSLVVKEVTDRLGSVSQEEANNLLDTK